MPRRGPAAPVTPQLSHVMSEPTFDIAGLVEAALHQLLETSCTVALPKSANCQRATIQTPQGFDAKHSDEVFPLSMRVLLSAGRLPATRENPGGGDGGRNFGRSRDDESHLLQI